MSPLKLLIVAASSLLLGCQAAPERAASLTLAVRADVTGFYPNPPIVNEGYTQDINWNIFEGLTGFDGRYRLVPALAQGWQNPDDRTYVFDLRPDLRFSDGSRLTAADVVASIETQLSRKWVFRGFLQGIESIRAEGEQRVVIRTRSPHLVLPFKLPWGMVLPRSVVDRQPVPAIGTGPYTLESWIPGQEFVLRRNPYYRGAAPAFEVARFVVEPDADKRLALLTSGRADVANQMPLERIAELEKRPDVRVYTGPGNRVLFLALRIDEPPFSDPRVREALDLALDREALIARALAGRGQAASQIVPASVAGYNPEISVTRPDRSRARKLLAEAGFPDGFAVTLDGTDNRYVNDRQILAEVARQLGDVGVRVEVNAQDKGVFFRRETDGELSFFLLGWACQTGEVGEALEPLFHSRTELGLGGENVFGLADLELDRLIGLANSSTTLPERLDHLRAAVARVAELRPILPLVVQPEAVGMSASIHWDPPVNYAFRLESLRKASD